MGNFANDFSNGLVSSGVGSNLGALIANKQIDNRIKNDFGLISIDELFNPAQSLTSPGQGTPPFNPDTGGLFIPNSLPAELGGQGPTISPNLGALSGAATTPTLAQIQQQEIAKRGEFMRRIGILATDSRFGKRGKQYAQMLLQNADQFLPGSSQITRELNALSNSVLNVSTTFGDEAALTQLQAALPQVSAQTQPLLQQVLNSENPIAELRNFRALLGGNEFAEKAADSQLNNQEVRFKTDENIREAEEKARIDLLKEQAKGSEPPKQSDIAGIRKEFTNLSKPFISVRDAYQRIQASSENPSPAGDLALIFNYMKMLDPGSVVRESEFATAENAASVPERIRARYNKVLEGEKLGSNQRKDFVDRADRLFKKQSDQHKKREDEFGRIADEAGIPKSQVLIDLNSADTQSAADIDQSLNAARNAIANGADPQAVRQRLIDNGIDPSGL